MRISDWSSDVCSSDLNGTYIDEIGTKEGWPEEYLRKNRETTDAQRAAFRRAVELGVNKIGSASCRERVCQYVSISVVAVSLQKKRDSLLLDTNNYQKRKSE